MHDSASLTIIACFWARRVSRSCGERILEVSTLKTLAQVTDIVCTYRRSAQVLQLIVLYSGERYVTFRRIRVVNSFNVIADANHWFIAYKCQSSLESARGNDISEHRYAECRNGSTRQGMLLIFAIFNVSMETVVYSHYELNGIHSATSRRELCNTRKITVVADDLLTTVDSRHYLQQSVIYFNVLSVHDAYWRSSVTLRHRSGFYYQSHISRSLIWRDREFRSSTNASLAQRVGTVHSVVAQRFYWRCDLWRLAELGVEELLIILRDIMICDRDAHNARLSSSRSLQKLWFLIENQQFKLVPDPPFVKNAR